jgi:hypothetical protein
LQRDWPISINESQGKKETVVQLNKHYARDSTTMKMPLLLPTTSKHAKRKSQHIIPIQIKKTLKLFTHEFKELIETKKELEHAQLSTF